MNSTCEFILGAYSLMGTSDIVQSGGNLSFEIDSKRMLVKTSGCTLKRYGRDAQTDTSSVFSPTSGLYYLAPAAVHGARRAVEYILYMEKAV